MEAERLLSLRQLRELMGSISMSSLIRLRKRGAGPREIKVGRRVFVSLSNYNEWAKSNANSTLQEEKNVE